MGCKALIWISTRKKAGSELTLFVTLILSRGFANQSVKNTRLDFEASIC
jgi:hypothetical protein